MNGLPKPVASRTLEQVSWNNSKLVKGNVGEEIAKPIETPGERYGTAREFDSGVTAFAGTH
jgi:hypothetical protein